MSKQTKIHPLKTWPRYFTDIITGRKTFEVRKDDRDFAVGDVLELLEWDPGTKQYTGRRAFHRVTYILPGDSGFLPDGTVVMSIQRDMTRMRGRCYLMGGLR